MSKQIVAAVIAKATAELAMYLIVRLSLGSGFGPRCCYRATGPLAVIYSTEVY